MLALLLFGHQAEGKALTWATLSPPLRLWLVNQVYDYETTGKKKVRCLGGAKGSLFCVQ